MIRASSGRAGLALRARIVLLAADGLSNTATLKPPPKKLGVTHWSSRLLGDHLGISNGTVATTWRACGIQPWRLETFITGGNNRAHPFTWTKTAAAVLAKANRQHTSNTAH